MGLSAHRQLRQGYVAGDGDGSGSTALSDSPRASFGDVDTADQSVVRSGARLLYVKPVFSERTRIHRSRHRGLDDSQDSRGPGVVEGGGASDSSGVVIRSARRMDSRESRGARKGLLFASSSGTKKRPSGTPLQDSTDEEDRNASRPPFVDQMVVERADVTAVGSDEDPPLSLRQYLAIPSPQQVESIPSEVQVAAPIPSEPSHDGDVPETIWLEGDEKEDASVATSGSSTVSSRKVKEGHTNKRKHKRKSSKEKHKKSKQKKDKKEKKRPK